jgi:adenosine kinase
MPLYEELVQKYKVHYIAGGAAQNSIRGAQVHTPFSTITFPNDYTYIY